MFFRLDVTPAPTAAFSFSPSDPSTLDNVQFQDESSDPGGVGIQSQAWTFGDGAIAEGCCPTHRYARDGDYTVNLTVTTADGRTGSTSRVVFAFTYTITAADQTTGKVNFTAVATITDHRDALPADNELASRPVKVT